MTRWSLRRKGRRARGASAGPPDAYRPDPYAAAASAGMPTAPEGMPASPEGPSAAPAAMAIAAPADADPASASIMTTIANAIFFMMRPPLARGVLPMRAIPGLQGRARQ